MVQIQRLIVSLSQGCRGQIKRNHSEKRTCERIAVEHGVGSATVRRAEKYSRGIDAAEEAVPGAQEEILTGHIKATDEQIVALASIPKEERPAILEELKKKKSDRDDTILERLKPSKPPPKPKSAPQKKANGNGKQHDVAGRTAGNASTGTDHRVPTGRGNRADQQCATKFSSDTMQTWSRISARNRAGNALWWFCRTTLETVIRLH